MDLSPCLDRLHAKRRFELEFRHRLVRKVCSESSGQDVAFVCRVHVDRVRSEQGSSACSVEAEDVGSTSVWMETVLVGLLIRRCRTCRSCCRRNRHHQSRFGRLGDRDFGHSRQTAVAFVVVVVLHV